MEAIFHNPGAILDKIRKFVDDNNSLHGGVKIVELDKNEWDEFIDAVDRDPPFHVNPRSGYPFHHVTVRGPK